MNDIVSKPSSWLAKKYGENTHIQALGKLAFSIIPNPFYSVADHYLTERYRQQQTETIKQLIDTLVEGDIQLTDEVIENNDFLYCVMRSVQATLRAATSEKTQIFAGVLTDFVNNEMITSKEEFDFLFSILEELTINELKLLLVIEKYEEIYYENGTYKDDRSEGLLRKLVKDILGVEVADNELLGWVVRLNRTGCYSMLGWRDGPAHDCRLTGLYYKLKKYILTLIPNKMPNIGV